jgi:hypothetical protein
MVVPPDLLLEVRPSIAKGSHCKFKDARQGPGAAKKA